MYCVGVAYVLCAVSSDVRISHDTKGFGWEKLAGAAVLVAAIPVIHYTGMAAASFTPVSTALDLSHAVGISTLGTAGIAGVAFLLLRPALPTSAGERRFPVQKLHRSQAYPGEAQTVTPTGVVGWDPPPRADPLS